jgi:hypothetical protein
MAFIVAGSIFAGSVALALWKDRQNYLRGVPRESSGALQTFVNGTVLAGAVAATHWLHIPW